MGLWLILLTQMGAGDGVVDSGSSDGGIAERLRVPVEETE